MNKRIIKIIYYIIFFGILLIFLAGCSNDENKVTSEKIDSEISYLDTKLLSMLNKANGISIENYIVKAEQVKETSDESKSSSSENGSQGDKSSDDQSKNSNNDGNSQGDNSNENKESSKNSKQYKMKENDILLQQRTTDWNSLKSDIERLYSSWNTIQLDLYKLNVNNQEILNFNSDLDMATQAIKNEDKIQTLNTLAKLYSYIPKYSLASSSDTKKNNIYTTKSNILNAYALVEQGDFEKVKNEMSKAEQSFMPIINNINSNTNDELNINKAYVLIKEIQNSLNNKDKDIFYIKYKNLIEELDIIK